MVSIVAHFLVGHHNGHTNGHVDEGSPFAVENPIMLPPVMLHCRPYGSRHLDLASFSLLPMLIVVFITVLAGRISLSRVRARFAASKI